MAARRGRPSTCIDALAASGDIDGWIEQKLAAGERLMGFGHRVFRDGDPRAVALRGAMQRLGPGAGRLAFAAEIEARVAAVFARLKPGRPPLQPNLEINAALLLDAVGIPREAFTPVFAVARSAGWLAHAMEQQRSGRLIRPSSAYIGPLPARDAPPGMKGATPGLAFPSLHGARLWPAEHLIGRSGERAVNDIAPSRYKWVGTRPIRPDGVPKVTGRAMYGADLAMAGALYGKIIRSPHAHARIRSIDASKALALPGVKAVVTAADFPDHKFEYVGPERVAQNFWHITRNVMAREKALYEGHAVAAVAAASKSVAEEAAALIEIDYEVLPHVIDVDEAMAPDAPLLFEDMITRGVEPTPTKPSNISKRLEFAIGDLDKGFAEADFVVEKEFKTAAVHQAYIEPHATIARVEADGQAEIWASSQGHFVVRALTAKLLGMPVGDVRVNPAEIGGGFGGKTVVYLEPVAAALSKKAGRPVKIVMSRDEVFKASGPTSGASMWVKIGVKKDGTLTAADGIFKFQAGAFPGSPVMNACLCAFAPYNIPNARTVGYDVVCNRPKSAAYRAPGSPISAFAVESVLDMLAKKIGMDPLQLRLKNAARPGTTMIYGPKMAHGGYVETLEALINHPDYQTPLGPEPGPRRRLGLLVQRRRRIERHGADQRGRHRRRRHRQPRYRRLARVDGADGGRDLRGRLQPGAGDRRRHRLDRLHPCDRRLARHLRHRHGGRRRQQEGRRRIAPAGGDDLGRRCRRRRLGRRPGQARQQQCRRFPADVAEGARRQEGADRRPDRRRGLGQRRRPGARLRHPFLRCRGRSRDRQGDGPALCRGAGCRQGDPSLLCRGADPGRRHPGHRLGVERGIHLRPQRPAR